jgi:hypothetical protein
VRRRIGTEKQFDDLRSGFIFKFRFALGNPVQHLHRHSYTIDTLQNRHELVRLGHCGTIKYHERCADELRNDSAPSCHPSHRSKLFECQNYTNENEGKTDTHYDNCNDEDLVDLKQVSVEICFQLDARQIPSELRFLRLLLGLAFSLFNFGFRFFLQALPPRSPKNYQTGKRDKS